MPRQPLTRRLALSALALASLLLSAIQAPAQSLDDAFRTPPQSARPMIMWQWVNGNVSREGITADLEAMKRVGIQAALHFEVHLPYSPDGPVVHGSPEWKSLLQHTAQEADRLGIEFGFHNSPGWSSSGGPWITPELSMQRLVWTTRDLDGPRELTPADLPKPDIDRRWNYYQDITLVAVPLTTAAASPTTPPPSSTVLSGSSLSLPPGRWRVFRFGHTTTGKEVLPAPPPGKGLEFDKFSPRAAEVHYHAYADKILRDFGPLAGRSVTMVEMDSYEAGPQTWGPDFDKQFLRRRGYDPAPWLPSLTGLTIGSERDTDRFREDIRRTIAELFDEACYGTYARLVRSRPGMKFALEPYSGPFDPLTVARHGDLVAATFWNGVAWGWNDILVTASACRTWGKNVVACEAFTGAPMATRWNQDPYALKAMGDRAFALGVNLMILHSFPHQPWKHVKPGMTLGYFGTHFTRTETWWDQSRPYFDYLSRCQYLLQQGRHATDLLILDRRIREFPPETTPPTTAPTTAPTTPRRPDLPPGYQADLISEKAFLERATVRDGLIRLPEGQTYRLLVLPQLPTLPLPVARKLRDFVSAGATVIGPRPLSTPGLEGGADADAELERLAVDLWDSGRIKPLSTRAALDSLGLTPALTTPSTDLIWTHRLLDPGHIFFLSNQSDSDVSADCDFQVTGLQPELWDPATGAITDARAFQQHAGTTRLPLAFAPRGSLFVVFRKPTPLATGPAKSNQPDFKPLAPLPGPWTLSFDPALGGPATIQFPTLQDWSQRPEPGIRFYSGPATSLTTFDFQPTPETRYHLNLGSVHNIAQVTLNDIPIATLWKPPFRCDITTALRPGTNRLSVRVTNLWPNRLIGDEQQPPDIEWAPESIWRSSKPELPIGRHLARLPDWLKNATPRPSPGRFTLTTFNYYTKDSPLLPSGLLGPVQIEAELKPAP